MQDEEIRRLIEQTVKATVKKMQQAKPSYDKARIFAKTEDILRSYPVFRQITGREQTAELIRRVEEALAAVKNDPYYDIIELMYFEGQSRNKIASYYSTNPKTIGRNRARLVRQISLQIFSDEIATEILTK